MQVLQPRLSCAYIQARLGKDREGGTALIAGHVRGTLHLARKAALCSSALIGLERRRAYSCISAAILSAAMRCCALQALRAAVQAGLRLASEAWTSS